MAPKKKKKDKEEWKGTDSIELELPDFNQDDQGQDLGGLMSVLKRKGGKKSKKSRYDQEEDGLAILAQLDREGEGEGEGERVLVVEEPVLEIPSSDLPVAQDNTPSVEQPVAPPSQIKSKKEKERERKERLKQAKKNKAPSKPVLIADPVVPDVPAPIPSPPLKKGKKKVPGAIAALREAVAAQKKQEELARLEREAEEKRLLDLELAEKEMERLKEEKRLLKKEAQRLKKEELKKQGKYLTPAQKQAQQAQKIKLEAMLASGVVVEAFKKSDEAPPKRSRPVYDNKKKKKNTVEPQKNSQISSAVSSKPTSTAPSESNKSVGDDEEVKDDWDQEEEDVKDAWDDSSEDEKPAETKTTKIVNKSAVVKETAAKSQEKAEMVQVKQDDQDGETESDDDDSLSESSSSSEKESSDEELTAAKLQALKRKEDAHARRQERIKASYAARSKDDLRSPIGVILGHVDTGKTKLLDKIRQTNVQEGEAGGITQQIGATYFPIKAIEEKTAMIHKDGPSGYQLPGLLMIDTPGHESFTNLRSRGSSLCNIAVLVVDIVHGLEPQTIESLNLLKMRKTPFIVALNKIDRLFDWKAHPNYPTRDTLALQKPSVISEFEDRVTKTIVEFAEQGLNACLYWENKNLGRNVSLVPTSAHTGEGVPDLLHLLIDLTQSRMTEKLMYLSELECTVLEVKVIEGLGTTIDVILSNGVLHEGDKICICGVNGPIVTNIRALLTPQEMRELRVKSAYQHHKTVKAALGIKIAAPDLEKAIAGSRLLVIGPDDDEEDIMEEVMGDLTNLMESIDKSGKGVCVQASTLGSLEALLSFLKDMKIPVSGINIGPVHKKDIIRASVMLERCKEYAQLLAFDVPIDKDAEQMAKDMGVQIFSANIIYHLFDKYTKYMNDLEEQKKKDAMPSAVFPCVLRMVPEAIFNKRSPIIIGVDVVEGVLKIGTPMCVVHPESKATIDLGKVVGIELNHKSRNEAKKGDPSVAIRIEQPNYATPATYGRHFTQNDDIYSKISRESIDVLKTTFRDKMGKEDWALVIRLKKILSIP